MTPPDGTIHALQMSLKTDEEVQIAAAKARTNSTTWCDTLSSSGPITACERRKLDILGINTCLNTRNCRYISMLVFLRVSRRQIDLATWFREHIGDTKVHYWISHCLMRVQRSLEQFEEKRYIALICCSFFCQRRNLRYLMMMTMMDAYRFP